MIEKPSADEKVEQGWLRIWLVFEVLAGKEAKAKEAIETLADKLEIDNRVKMYKKEFSEIRRIENPMKDVKEGFSLTCDVELIVENFDNIVQVVLEYGPSVVEILEPNKLDMKVGEAQSILNSIAQMMHRFAAAGVGGIVFLGQKE